MNTPLRVLVDGAEVQAAWPTDRGLLYGDGVFETLTVRSGRLRFEADHRARLADGCRRLGFNAELDGIWADAARVAGEVHAATLRLQVTRGHAMARGYSPTGAEHAQSILCVYPAPSAGEWPAAPQVVTLALRLGENPALAGLKHCNRLEQILGRIELRGSGAFEGIMASSSGHLISGTMSNVFLEVDGELVTPAVDRCGVAGVLRAVALRAAASLGIAVRVTTLPLEAAARCTAMALCNARMGLIAVDRLDGRSLRSNAALQQLATAVAQ